MCPQNAYTRAQPSLDYLHRRRQEIMAQLEERKVVSSAPFGSSHSYDPSYPQDMRGQSHVSQKNILLNNNDNKEEGSRDALLV